MTITPATPPNPQVDNSSVLSCDFPGPGHTVILTRPPPALWKRARSWPGGPDTGQPFSTCRLSLSLFRTNMYRIDFKFVKVVEDSLIFSVDVPVVAQSPEELALAVVGPRHDALGEIHHPLLEELIWGIQRTNEFWREGEARELTPWLRSLQAGAGGRATARPNVWLPGGISCRHGKGPDKLAFLLPLMEDRCMPITHVSRDHTVKPNNFVRSIIFLSLPSSLPFCFPSFLLLFILNKNSRNCKCKSLITLWYLSSSCHFSSTRSQAPKETQGYKGNAFMADSPT